MKRLQAAYNGALRILLKRPRWGSASEVFVSTRANTLQAVVRNIVYKFTRRLDVSE